MPRNRNCLLRTYFEVRNDKHVICKNGKCNNKLLNAHSGNLERHLKTFHPDIFRNYIQKKGSNVLNGSKSDTVKLSCSVNKKHIQLALIELFTKCGRPLCLAEDQPFKIMFKPLLDELKIKHNVQNIIENIAEFSINLQKDISKELSGRLISLKLDAATRSSQSLLSVSVQFVQNNCVVLKTLGMKPLTQSHNSQYLKSLILEVLAEYAINLDQVIAITTNNGIDTIEVADDLSSSSNEFAEICVDLDFSIDGISYVRCGAHTLQMCMTDILASADIKKKLDIIRTIIKKLRSQVYLKLLKGKNCQTPILDHNSNWATTYQMLEGFMQLKDFIDGIKNDIAIFEASNEILSFVDEFLKVFKVIYNTSQKLLTAKFIYSDLYIEITSITLQLGNLPKSDLKLYLTESLNREKLLLFENDLFITAVFLDPRIKVCLASDQCARAKSCIMQLYTRLIYLREGDTKFTKPSAETYESSSSSNAAPLTGNAEDALEEYFKGFDQFTNHNIFTTTQQIEEDILAYGSQPRLGIKENIIDFWNKQKNALTEIAHLVLAIPCTQITVERLFAALDYMQANQTSSSLYSCNSIKLEHILLVKSNAEFVYD